MVKKKKKKKKSFGTTIRELFKKDCVSQQFFEDLEELLLSSDMGATVTMEISDQLRESIKKEKIDTFESLIDKLRDILSSEIITSDLEIAADKLNIFLVLGVNGVGKTTSIAKLVYLLKQKNSDANIILAAADTFRAAAIEQLQHHGDKLKVPVISHQSGSDPGAVVFDAIQSALAKKSQIVIADTAGRMHNKGHLVKELQKISKIIEKQSDNAIIKKILVLDATTGQNSISQAEVFHEAVGIDGIIMSKYDSLSKGGMAVTISRRLNIPFLYVGTGEKYIDFYKFEKEEFLDRIMNS